MNQFIVPELYCPFPTQINKHIDTLEKYAIEWALRFNLLANESSYQRLLNSNFFLLTAGAYPYCQLEELKIAHDWLNWLFIWDDQCDLSDLRKQPEMLKVFHKRFLEILKGAEHTSKDIPLAYALSDLRQRMLQRESAKWFNCFVHSVESYFHGCVLEAKNRTQGTIPDIDTYTMIRMLCGAVDSTIELIEFCNHLRLFDSLQEYDVVKNLRLKTNKILCWCNDIFSLNREMLSGEVHNLVLVLHYQQHLSLEQAIKSAAKMHDDEVRVIMNLEGYLPSLIEQISSDEINQYISGMYALIAGNFHWSSQSTRYHTVENMEQLESLALVKS